MSMDKKKIIEAMIRVNHAGEYGAENIYKGQIAVLKNLKVKKILSEMLEEEQKHLNKFNEVIIERRIRPTLLSPLWKIGGYSMGVVTAILGPKSTMACTEAVEEVICEHYAKQAIFLKNNDKELFKVVTEFIKDEEKHKNEAIGRGTGTSLRHKLLKKTIRGITKTAIKISQKI